MEWASDSLEKYARSIWATCIVAQGLSWPGSYTPHVYSTSRWRELMKYREGGSKGGGGDVEPESVGVYCSTGHEKDFPRAHHAWLHLGRP